MRKILLIVIIVLLLVFGYVALAKGIQIGGLHISSIMQIEEHSKQLEGKTEELNSLIDIEYPSKMTQLKEASNKMQDTKKQYLDETNLSSDEEIQNALQVESYDIERLWAKVGGHAKAEGVNLKLVLNSSSSGGTDTKDLSFTVDGSYIGITNFVYAIEDDEELDFRIYNFKLVPRESDILQGTFEVKDVRITSTSLNDNLTSSISSNTQTEEKTNTEADSKENTQNQQTNNVNNTTTE